MRKILSLSVAGAALIAVGCTTAAMANDDANIRENLEIIVQNAEATGQSVIIHGVNAEVLDSEVIITGDAVRTTADGRVIITGSQADILPSGAGHRTVFRVSEGHNAMRLAEAAAELERLEGLHIEIDDIHTGEMERAMALVEREMANLDERRIVIFNNEERELSEEEREEVRRELAEAHAEIRTSMRDVEADMRAAEGERRQALRVMRIEMERAEQQLTDADNEVRRVHIIARRDQARAEPLIRELREGGARRLRFISENGEDRVWIDGEELEGDSRIEWLNRLETERLAGGRTSEPQRIIIEIDDDETD